MENFLLSLNVIAPLLLLLSVGILLNKIKLLTPAVTKAMNKVVAVVLLPILIFNNIYKGGSTELFDGKVVLFCVLGIIIEFIAAYFLVLFLTKDVAKRGVMLQGMFRSNYVIFGLPIAISLFGDEGSAAAAVLTAVVIPCFNILAVFALEIFNGGKLNFKNILFKIVTNPLIIASILGLVFSQLHIPIPNFIYSPLSQIAASATPMAFIFLGATLAFNNIGEHIKELSVTVAMRLIIFPAILVSTAVLLGFRDVWLVVILTLFASPTAVSSFSLAQTLGGDDKLAANVVVFASVASIVTMFLWIFTLKSMALI